MKQQSNCRVSEGQPLFSEFLKSELVIGPEIL